MTQPAAFYFQQIDNEVKTNSAILKGLWRMGADKYQIAGILFQPITYIENLIQFFENVQSMQKPIILKTK